MLFTKVACAVALSSAVYAADSLTLSSTAIQKGSTVDGSKEVGAAEVGQALSVTSTNNFINYCDKKILTNGLQQVGGSCNGIGKCNASDE